MKLGQGPNIQKLHVFDEPHKRYNPVTELRERHKHLIFKMASPFAHTKFCRELAGRRNFDSSLNFLSPVGAKCTRGRQEMN